jgi:hypothetical protein
MGFATYDAYLKSDLWNWVRSNLSQLHMAEKCMKCGVRIGLIWHHRWYSLSVLVGNVTATQDVACAYSDKLADTNPVVRLCCKCHEEIHFDADGKFITDLKRVDARLSGQDLTADWQKEF